MQNPQTLKALGLAFILLIANACNWGSGESAADAIQRSRGTLIDQVNSAGDGTPFYTVKTLNPIWSETPQTPIVRMPRLQLVDQNAKTRTEALFTGKTSIVAFMFTSCNGFCPMLVQKLKGIADRIGNRDDLQYVAISVDPEVDTPERLAAYAATHKLDTKGAWTLLTGTEETIYSLAKETFASQVFKRPGAGPRDFVHAGHLYVIDREGRLRGILNGTSVNVSAAADRLVKTL